MLEGCTHKAIILMASSRTHQMKRDEVLAILAAHQISLLDIYQQIDFTLTEE